MTNSLTPASQDNGRSVAQRAWMLSFPRAVAARDFQTKATEVLIFDVRAEWLGRQRASFDQWNDESDNLRHIEGLFQLFVTGISKMSDAYQASAPDTFQNAKCPIKIFLEAVLCDPVYERNAKETNYDALERLWTIQKLEEIYDGRVTAAELQSCSSASSAVSDRIEFMHGYSNRRVASYRIWVLINEPTVKLSEAIMTVFQGCCDRENDRLKQDKLAADGSRGKKRAVPGAEQPRDISSAPVSELINDQERHWLINTAPLYTFVVGTYLGNHAIINENKDDIAMSARMPIKNPDNQVHPAKVFGARAYFADCARKRHDIDARQRTIDRYYNPQTHMWSFQNARANCVLVIGAEHWKTRSLLTMYTPDYQLRSIEPRLVWRQRARPPIAADPLAPAASQPASGAPPEVAGAGEELEGADDETSDLSAADMTLHGLGGSAPPAPAPLAPLDAGSAMEEDGDDDSSAELDERIAEYREALLAPVQRRTPPGLVHRSAAAVAHAAEVRRMIAELPPPREMTAEEIEREELEQERNYMHMLRMGFQDRRVRARAEELASAGSLGGTAATVCHELRSRYFLNEAPLVEAIEDETVRTTERLKMSLRGIEEYLAKASSPFANVSPPHQAMNGWATEQRRLGRLKFVRQSKFIDSRLSCFAHKVIQVYADAEKLCAMHTSHDVLFLLYVASRSALVYDRDKLRNNVLIFGEHATSKSYALTELAKNMLIPRTVQSVTSQSKQAANTDTNCNDVVMIHEELQQSLISRNTKETESQDSFKDALTRGASTRLVCHIAADGRRQQLVVESEKNMCMIAACNSKREDIAKPIADRMIMVHSVERHRTGHTMSQMQQQSHNRGHKFQLDVADMKHDYYLRQCIHNDVEKFIMIGTIAEPHLACFGPLYSFYENVLSKEFSINVKRRQVDQLRMMLRSLIIMSAIEWLYNSPAGFCYGKAYSPYHLLLLEPMLHDTEELVYFVLDVCRHMLVDPNQEALVEFFRTIWVPSIVGKEIESLQKACRARDSTEHSKAQSAQLDDDELTDVEMNKLSDEFQRMSTGGAISAETSKLNKFFQSRVIGKDKAKGSSADTADAEPKLTVDPIDVNLSAGDRGMAEKFDDVQAAMIAAKVSAEAHRKPAPDGADKPSGKKASKAAADASTLVVDYNYFVFPDSKKKLATAVAAHMAQIKFRRSMGAQTIMDVLDEMSKQTIATQNYQRAPPERWPPVCADSKAQRYSINSPQVRFGGIAGDEVMIHSSLAFFERKSPHENAIAKCMNQYTPVGFFIAGRPVSDQIPHLVYVRRCVQTRRLPSVQLGDATVMLSMSYDEYSTKERLEWLGIPVTRVAMHCYNPIYSDSYARSMPGSTIDEPIIYPDDMIKAEVKATRHNMDIKQMLAAGITTDSYGNRLGGITLQYAEPRRAPSAAAEQRSAHVPDAYSRRQVYTDDDYHNDETDSVLYDRTKIPRINLGVYNDPHIVRAEPKAAPRSAAADIDNDFDGAVEARDFDSRAAAVAAASVAARDAQVDLYADEVHELEMEDRWQAQGNREVIIPDTLSNMATFDYDEDADSDDDDADADDENTASSRWSKQLNASRRSAPVALLYKPFASKSGLTTSPKRNPL